MYKKTTSKKGVVEKKHTDVEMKRYIGAILEDVNDKFKATAEGTTEINEKLNKIQSDIDDLKIELRETKLEVQDISHGININLDKKVDRKLFLDLDSRVKILEKK